MGCQDSRTHHAPADPGDFPPDERTFVLTLACEKTEEHDTPDSSWTLDQLAYTIINKAHHQAMSRATIHRILAAADLKPHQSVYWLNSHDPDFAAKAKDICQLYLNAPKLQEQGRIVLSCDEKTGMQILQRKYATIPPCPALFDADGNVIRRGRPAKREFEYIRHGTRCLLTTFCVGTGKVAWDLTRTRTSADWVAHLEHARKEFPSAKGCDWVVDNLNTHWSLEVCRMVGRWCGVPVVEGELSNGIQRRAFLSDPSHAHVFHFTPIHGSWLNQVELFFSVLSRRLLRRGDFSSVEEFQERVERWLCDYNERHAHPYRWTYTGEPLVRDTPFSQTRQQRRQGRAFFGRRPQLFERRLQPPRLYRRKVKPLAANL